jgi:hypothetical protein
MAARIAALGAAVIVAAVAALHLYGTFDDDEPGGAANAVVYAVALGTAAALAAAAPFVRGRERRFGFLATATVLVTALAIFAAASVGPLLVPAVLLLGYAAFAGLG